MGLDMYLYEKEYISPYTDEEKFNKISSAVGTPKIKYLVYEVGYWRKANHIHSWFVENVQNGVDDCGTYAVSSGDLLHLRDACQRVLDSSRLKPAKVLNGHTISGGKSTPNMVDGLLMEDTSLAEELLPRERGFFFGGYEYDSWYIEDLKDTIKIVDEAIDQHASYQNFEYQSSW